MTDLLTFSRDVAQGRAGPAEAREALRALSESENRDLGATGRAALLDTGALLEGFLSRFGANLGAISYARLDALKNLCVNTANALLRVDVEDEGDLVALVSDALTGEGDLDLEALVADVFIEPETLLTVINALVFNPDVVLEFSGERTPDRFPLAAVADLAENRADLAELRGLLGTVARLYDEAEDDLFAWLRRVGARLVIFIALSASPSTSNHDASNLRLSLAWAARALEEV